MSALSLLSIARLEAAPAKALVRRGARWALTGLGFLIIAVGAVGAVLPGHLGVPLLVVGLAVVLRTSYSARRSFIKAQRRHPKIVFPLRRLLRREPEVLPVFWQQILRTERWVLPRRWRGLGRARRRLMRRRTR